MSRRVADGKLPITLRASYADSVMRLGITPSGPELLQRGELYVKATRFSKAIPCFEQLADRGNLPLNMRLRALDHLATCYKNTSQYAKSLNTVLKLVATPNPDSLWYY